jgi:hypothetical protein
MEHSLHIAAKHFIEAVAPASPANLRKKIKAVLHQARVDDNLDLDGLDTMLSDVDLTQEFAGTDGSDSENEDFTSGDSLGKALALVKQVSPSIKLHSELTVFKTDPKIPSGSYLL